MEKKPINIAIADDHYLFRKGLMMLLENIPEFRITCDVNNGKELLAYLRPENIPDVILLDIRMPEMDGYQTAAYIFNT